MDYPRDVKVETPLGDVFITITSGKHIHAEANSNGKFITVNGVKVTCSLHLDLVDNEWVCNRKFFSSTRKDSYKDSSPAAKDKIIAVVIPLISEFVAKNPDLLNKAKEVAIDSRKSYLETAIATKEQELSTLRAELANLVKGEAK